MLIRSALRFTLLSLPVVFAGTVRAEVQNGQKPADKPVAALTADGRAIAEPPAQRFIFGAPSNDDCANALPIVGGLNPIDTTGATTDGLDVPAECDEGFGVELGQDVWFEYFATCTDTLLVSTCNDGDPNTGDAEYDTRLAVYDGCDACPPSNDDLVACNDDGDGCAGFSSSLEVAVTAGNCYLMRVGGFGTESGNMTLAVQCGAGFCGNGQCDVGEGICNCDGDCGTAEAGETPGTDCQDGADNDCDGFYDCADSECAGDALCSCPQTCTGGSIAEGEPTCVDAYEDTTNPGCFVNLSTDTPTFGSISIGDTVCGEAGNFHGGAAAPCSGDSGCNPPGQIDACTMDSDCGVGAGATCGLNIPGFCDNGVQCGAIIPGECDPGRPLLTADSDWYEFTVATEQRVSWCVTAGFAVDVSILEAECIDNGEGNFFGTALIIADAEGPPCSETCVESCLPPGTYTAFVRENSPANNVPCGSLYNATLSGTACPPNSCSDAIVVTDGSTPYDNTLASTDGEPHPGTPCEFDTDDIPGQLHNDVWFDYTATCTGQLTASVCDADHDTRLAIYDTLTCPPTTLLQCDDDSCTGLTSSARAAVTAGNAYKIRVGAFSPAQSGGGTLVISCDVPPPNDDCANAAVVTEGATAFTNVGALDDGPAECGTAPTPIVGDIWFDYTASCEGTLNISTCPQDNDMTMAVYDGHACPAVSAIGCDDDGCGTGSGPIIDLPVNDAQQVKIQLGSFGNVDQTPAFGPGTLTIAITCDSACDTAADCCDSDANNVKDNPCDWCECIGGPVSSCNLITVPVPADVGGVFGACPPDGFCTIHDRTHALRCFSGSNSCASINIDAGSAFGACGPDGLCDLHDANHALSCFAGSNTCGCGPAPETPSTPSVIDEVELQVVASRRTVAPGTTVDVRVFLADPTVLQSYQLHLGASGGKSGQLQLERIHVEPRRDLALAGGTVFDAVNVDTAQMLRGIDEAGLATREQAYLATFTYRVPRNAAGTFVIDVLHDASNLDQTFLIAAYTDEIAILRSTPAIITVAADPRPTARASGRARADRALP